MRAASVRPRSCPLGGRPMARAEPYLTVAASECGSGTERRRRRRQSRTPAAACAGNPGRVAEGVRSSGRVAGPKSIAGRSVRRAGCARLRRRPAAEAKSCLPGTAGSLSPAERMPGAPRTAAADRGKAQRRHRPGRRTGAVRTEAAGRVRHRGSARRSARSTKPRAPGPGPASPSRCSGREPPPSGSGRRVVSAGSPTRRSSGPV